MALAFFAGLGALGIAQADSPRVPAAEAPFLAENRSAMDRMMAGMSITPSGDVDHDFVAMMIPHHQGAIDMAQAELRHGHNEQLRRIAQEIIVDAAAGDRGDAARARRALPPRLADARLARSALDDRRRRQGAMRPMRPPVGRRTDRGILPAGRRLPHGPARRPARPPRPTSRSATVTGSMPPSSSPTPSPSSIPPTTSCSASFGSGDPTPTNFSPLYKGQVLVHGMGFSPDHRTIAVVSIGSNSVTFIDTATNAVKHITYVGRAPHEAFFTPDGKEVWVTVRGENYVAVLDGTTYEEKTRITLPNGPGMQIFSPDGKYGYVCSSLQSGDRRRFRRRSPDRRERCSRRARSVPTSPRHPMARRSGSR